MTNLEERIAKSKARTAKLERLRREEIRKEREHQKKIDQRRNYIVGELVTKYFPEVKEMKPENKEKNIDNFILLDAFLSVLSSRKKLIDDLKEEALRTISQESEKAECLHSDSPDV